MQKQELEKRRMRNVLLRMIQFKFQQSTGYPNINLTGVTGVKIKFIVFTALVTSFVLPACAGSKNADYYYALGIKQEADKNYSNSLKSFSRSASMYVKENAPNEKLISAKNGVYRSQCILYDFSLTPSKFKSKLKKDYPWADMETIEKWISSKSDTLLKINMFENKTFYYFDEVANMKYRDQAIMTRQNEYKGNPLNNFMAFFLENFVKADYSDYKLPYDRPKDILLDFQFIVKKSKLPKNGDGIVRIWWPMPINTDCQNSITMISKHIEPTPSKIQEFNPDSNIGVIYIEIPINSVQKHILIRTQVRYIRYQQRFIIDHQSIQPYDEESSLFKEYTKESMNIAITPEIKEKAQVIIGSETNPFLCAKLINYYIINNVDYSFPEYNVNDAYAIPLSTYTHQHQFGDCGYQSVYFTAMCRSIKIPARACGGFQLFSGHPDTHFWAEFYLPEPYNKWIPVDVTASELYKEVLNYSEEDLKAYRDYFFTQQDPFRTIIQNDVDILYEPLPENGNYFFKACLQEPLILFYGTDRNITMFSEHKKFYTYGTYNFNYDNAIKSVAGAELELHSSFFGLEVFDEKSKYQLKDKYLEKEIVKNLKIKEFSADKKNVIVIIPQSLLPFAYRIICVQPKKKEISADRFLILEKK